jgi:nucleotide-binding universal stress UspA family protein
MMNGHYPQCADSVSTRHVECDAAAGEVQDEARDAGGEYQVTTMRILLPIDDSECSERALQTVIRQFQSADTEVRVLHVDEWPKGMPLSLAFAEGPGTSEQILGTHQEMRQRSRELMAHAVEQLQAARFRATSELMDGDARRVILDVAAEWRPDVIVIGSHGRCGLQRFVLGSVAESVMRHASCSVEVVRTTD